MSEKKTQPAKSRKNIKFVYIGIAAVIIILGLVSIFGKSKETLKEVEVVSVMTDTLSREVSANGTIQTRTKANLVSSVAGTVSKVYVEEGDRVRKNELVALLDKEKTLVQYKEAVSALEGLRRNIKGELLSLRTGYTQAKTSFEQAERAYTNIKGLHEIGSASDDELARAGDTLEVANVTYSSALQRLNFREGRPLDDARTVPSKPDDQIIENSAEVRQAIAALDSIASALRNNELRSSIAGTIVTLSVEEGSVVGPGTPIAVIYNQDALEITSNIDEVDIGYLTIGQDVRIESDAFINRSLKGKVSKIAPIIQRIGDSRVCEINVTLVDPDKIAKIGASCSIYIEAQHKENIPVIPIELYVQDGNKKYVWKADAIKDNADGAATLSKIEIQTGIIGIEKVEVIKGLAIGDKIASGDLKSYVTGQKIKPKDRVAGKGK
jgi:RND family efflux transporter MFP subunit